MAESAACVSTVFSADHPMCEAYSDFLPLRAVTVSADGKRKYDEGDEQRLIEACLLAGVLVAGIALIAGVNANQLRRWIVASTRRSRRTLPQCRCLRSRRWHSFR